MEQHNLLFYGDNLEVLRRYGGNDEVDLVYLDPPFKSDSNYNVLFAEKDGTKSASQIQAFSDTWTWDVQSEKTYAELVIGGGKVADCLEAFRKCLGTCDLLAYLVMMAPRLIELRRVMKPTASIYLHCDPTASHYLKMLMDAVFGADNFKSEIVWKRTNARSTKGRWPRLHDVILFYGRSDNVFFASTTVKADTAKLPHTLITGKDGLKYQTYELTAPGVTKEGESGRPWRGFDPSSMGRHWANTQATMNEWDEKDEIHWPKNGGFPRRRGATPFVEADRTITVGDVWTDIDRINQSAKELLGYPTQKPLALLERIIQASSNPGDVVLDPFCGCGTTVTAAEKLGRRWVGIDVTHLAISLMKERLKDSFGLVPNIKPKSMGEENTRFPYKVIGEPVSVNDAQALADSDPYQFQWWALGLVGARPVEQKKGADHGIDGTIIFQGDEVGKFDRVIISVKAGKTQVSHVRDLKGVLEREKAVIGVLISMQEPTQPMRTEAATAGFYESQTWGKQYPRIQLLTIEELLAGKGIEMPPIKQVSQTFKKAEKVYKKETEQGELGL